MKDNKKTYIIIGLVIIVIVLICLLAVLINKPINQKMDIPEHYLSYNISLSKHLLGDKPDLVVAIDDKEIGTIKNKTISIKNNIKNQISLQEGEHTISFMASGKGNIQKKFIINADVEFECEIDIKDNEIVIKKQDPENFVK